MDGWSVRCEKKWMGVFLGGLVCDVGDWRGVKRWVKGGIKVDGSG